MRRFPIHYYLLELDPPSPPAPSSPQFTLKRLLASVTLIAAGVALIGYALRAIDLPMPTQFLVLFTFWFTGGVIVGAGALDLIGRPKLGAALGFFFQVPTWIALAFLLASRGL